MISASILACLVGKEAQDLQIGTKGRMFSCVTNGASTTGLATTTRNFISQGSEARGVPCFDATFDAANIYWSRNQVSIPKSGNFRWLICMSYKTQTQENFPPWSLSHRWCVKRAHRDNYQVPHQRVAEIYIAECLRLE